MTNDDTMNDYPYTADLKRLRADLATLHAASATPETMFAAQYTQERLAALDVEHVALDAFAMPTTPASHHLEAGTTATGSLRIRATAWQTAGGAPPMISDLITQLD